MVPAKINNPRSTGSIGSDAGAQMESAIAVTKNAHVTRNVNEKNFTMDPISGDALKLYSKSRFSKTLPCHDLIFGSRTGLGGILSSLLRRHDSLINALKWVRRNPNRSSIRIIEDCDQENQQSQQA
jgi:hypothetical protein